jgi:hypothetical protein
MGLELPTIGEREMVTLGDTVEHLVAIAGMASGWIEKRGTQWGYLTIGRRDREQRTIGGQGIVTLGGSVLRL